MNQAAQYSVWTYNSILCLAQYNVMYMGTESALYYNNILRLSNKATLSAIVQRALNNSPVVKNDETSNRHHTHQNSVKHLELFVFCFIRHPVEKQQAFLCTFLNPPKVTQQIVHYNHVSSNPCICGIISR